MRFGNDEKHHLDKIKIVISLLIRPNGNISGSGKTRSTLISSKKAEPHYVFETLKKLSSYCSVIIYKSNENPQNHLKMSMITL